MWEHDDIDLGYQPFTTTEIVAEEINSLKINCMHSSPQFNQASPTSGIQLFIYELEANGGKETYCHSLPHPQQPSESYHVTQESVALQSQ